MNTEVSRRHFMAVLASAAAASSWATSTLTGKPQVREVSPFKLSVFTDEIDQNFEHACEVASQEFQLQYVELRRLWKKNVVDLDKAEVEKAKEILQRFGLKVSCISGPLFKVAWPGGSESKTPPQDSKAGRDSLAEQDKVFRKEMEMAKAFGTDRIRCFDFFRLKDAGAHQEAIYDKLNQTADEALKNGLLLVMENEPACNTGTAAESARTLKAVHSPGFKLIWDPGNHYYADDSAPYPTGYDLLPKDRIGHVHVKDASKNLLGKPNWVAVGTGSIDYVGQFKALLDDGYTGPVVLETHWHGASSVEESTRICINGMKEQLRKAGALKPEA